MDKILQRISKAMCELNNLKTENPAKVKKALELMKPINPELWEFCRHIFE